MSTDGWQCDHPPLRLLLAPNPGPMTLEGTNTWVVGDPGAGPSVVVDPGPADEGHLQRVLAWSRGGIAEILLTHRHADHAEGAARLAELAGCGVRAVDPELGAGAPILADGEVIEAPEATLAVVATPGHTADSISLLVTGAGEPRLLTGDTVLGRGTSVVAEPDGNLAAYLDSLARLRRVADHAGVTQLLPGHGPVVDDPVGLLNTYVEHRLARLDQVRAALQSGDITAEAVVARVYADVDRALWPVAEQSVRAQLRYLAEHP